jgi:hypothetical protein
MKGRAMKRMLVLLIASLMVLMACGGGSAPSSTSSASPKHVSPFDGTSGYILQFGDDFKLGMNAVDDFGISVVIAMDVSGSMADPPQSGGEAKYVQAAKALSTVASYLEALASKQKDLKIQVCILKFSSGVDVVLPLTTLNTTGVVILNAAISPKNFTPNAGTAIGGAMEVGTRILAQSGTIFNSLIIVTDGENNVGPDPRDVMKAIYSNRNTATTQDYKISTSTQLVSFVGFDVQSHQFKEFHDLGARITSANSQVEIENGLKSFLEADITKLEGK